MFTTAQAAQLRSYLGYPQVYLKANPRLESAILVVGANADALALALAIMADVANVDATIAAIGLPSAGVAGLDKGDVQLHDDNKQLEGMNREGRKHCARLSHLFGVPIANDYFGRTGYSGDGWKTSNARPKLAGLG